MNYKPKDTMQPILLPCTDWEAPTELPNMNDCKRICIDLETNDPWLKTKGPGWCFKKGHVAGIAIGSDDGGDIRTWYFPIGHEQGENWDQSTVVGWLKDLFMTARVGREVVFFNSIYDLGWLDRLGITIHDKIKDPMLAAALLDENRRYYNLDSVSREWVGEKKDEELLKLACLAFGHKDHKANMWRVPPQYVGPYAEQDVRATLLVHKHVEERIKDEGLSEVYQLELDQVPILLKMRKIGVRIDVDRATSIGDEFTQKVIGAQNNIKTITELDVDIWSNLSIEKAFNKLKLEVPRTEKGNPSFTAAFLESHNHAIAQNIVNARKYNRAQTTFTSGLVLDYAHNGRIHCQFNQLRSDNYGTVSGRYSSSTPNLQQIPARDPEIGPLVRSLFIPEKGKKWAKCDYSQQEPRLTVHYASKLKLTGSEKALNYYRHTPNPDYHQMVADMAGIERKKAKTINLGLAYGMGKKKLADALELSDHEAEDLFSKYHAEVPFVRGLSYEAADAARRGYITTLLGRRCRFDKWESCDWDLSKTLPAQKDRGMMLLMIKREMEKAKEAGEPLPNFGVRRAFTYRAMNRLIQGSAADMTKRALVNLAKEGFIPHIQVHDEFDLSVNDEKEALRVKEIMESSVELLVPVQADVEIGSNWGNTKKIS